MGVLPTVRVYALVAVLAAVVLGGATAQYMSAKEEAPPVPAFAAAPAAAAPITVYVSGAVAKPGIYQVPSGVRVAEVLALAGGAGEEADLQRVNLAQKAKDGLHIRVPERKLATAKGQSSRTTASGAGNVSLNRADEAELDRLPGIGPVLAAQIVRYRQEHGAFRSLEELQRVPGIGPDLVERLRGRASL